MYKPLALFIGFRYLKAKKRNHFISFISIVSFLGIALGVAVLITVLSVMNGFDKEIKNRILVMVPQVMVSQWGGKLENWQQLESTLKKNKEVTGLAPVVQGQGMLSYRGYTSFGMILGINPKLESSVSPIGSKLVVGDINDLQPRSFGIILGEGLARSIDARVGEKITLIVPQASLTPAGLMPRLKQFKVVGIFDVGYQYNANYAFINIDDAATLFKMGDSISGIQLKLANLYEAPQITAELNGNLPAQYNAMDWTQQNRNFFQALQMEKTMMFLILILIVAVAAFNMLASLVMVVTDKQSDIAILRTLGASSRRIMNIFIIQGLSIGIIGTAIGTGLGVLLSLNTTAIVNWIQQTFNVQFLSASVYYIDFVPSSLEFSDVIKIVVVALIMSFFATLYPAWRASKVQPAEALRYE
ncbi:lipoprotein-releasing ABC transporter permease subunit [Francisellaceae bacterium]|nr:lipoprotein-releasing ABC transporter permease subunit [Francisellaceae bacterium]